MKKGRIITATILVATMLIGAGYASWTSSTKINHNITTGNMDVQFIAPHYSSVEVSGDQYVQPTVNRTAHEVTFTLNNLYPGASYTTLTEEKNTGTIGVKFDNAVVTIADGSNAVLAANTTVDFDCWVFNEAGVHIGTITPTQSNIHLNQLQSVLNSTLANVRLEPNQYLRLQGHSVDQSMTFTFNDGATVTNDTQNKSLSFSIQLNWKQFNK